MPVMCTSAMATNILKAYLKPIDKVLVLRWYIGAVWVASLQAFPPSTFWSLGMRLYPYRYNTSSVINNSRYEEKVICYQLTNVSTECSRAMTTGAFSQNIGKLFSELIFSSFMQQAEKPQVLSKWWLEPSICTVAMATDFPPFFVDRYHIHNRSYTWHCKVPV